MKLVLNALRAFKRFKLYSLVNLFGLSLGLICSIVIILFVRFHFSFDNFHADKDRIYRVSEIATSPDGKEISPSVRFPVGQDLKDAFAEIESFAQAGIQSHEYLLKHNENITTIHKTIYASQNFFSFFSFSPVLGNVNDFLTRDDALVITEPVSHSIFGNSNPIGQSVILNNKNYVITGVVENPPNNSHIKFDAITSINQIVNQPDIYLSWDGGLSVPTFIKLKKGASRKDLEAKIPDLVWEKVNKKDSGSGFSTQLFLEPLTSIHANSKVEWDPFSRKEASDLYTLLFIGIFVLLIAFVNFLFLTHGILQLRIKEFGVKRYLGLNKKGMLQQLWIENSLIFTGSAIIAVFVTLATSPQITKLFGDSFISQQLLINKVYLVLGLLSLIIISTVTQYLFLMKKLAINQVSQAFIKSSGRQKTLWVTSLQFATSIVLIIGIIVIYKQLSFINHADLGFKSKNIINISNDKIGEKQEVLRSELTKISGVNSVSASFGIPGLETTQNGYRPQGTDQWQLFNALYVDDEFFKTYQLNLIKGRGFNRGNDVDKNSIIINETLAKQLGWENPIGKTIFRNQDLEIVGVVKDFHVALMYYKVPPLIISKQWKPIFYTLSISLNTQNLTETLHQLEHKWEQIMPNTPFNYTFLDARFQELYNNVHRTAKILIIFAIISILISVLGLFALTVLVLNTKVKQIGIRKVNGATVNEVLFWINKSLLVWIVVAFILSAPIAYLSMQKWLSQFAYRTDISWWIFGLAGISVVMVALLTVSWQSFVAAKQNPVEALKYE